jgi:TolA-binding protein
LWLQAELTKAREDIVALKQENKSLKAANKRLEDALEAMKGKVAKRAVDEQAQAKRKEEEPPRTSRPAPKKAKASNPKAAPEEIDVEADDLQTTISRCLEERLQ